MAITFYFPNLSRSFEGIANQIDWRTWEKLTDSPDCMQCHGKMNHLGFALEGFDSLGRHREQEFVYTDQNGNYVPVDLNLVATPEIIRGEGDLVRNGNEFAKLLANHPVTKKCFAKRMFRFIFEQPETLEDRCLLEKTQENQPKDTLGIKGMYRDFILRGQGILPDAN